MKKVALALFATLALSAIATGASSVWEGTAMMSGYGEFPTSGYYAASDSFARNTTITVTNLENGKSVDVVVTRELGNPGLFLLLSPEAAASLGIGSGVVVKVRASKSTAGLVPSTGSSGARGSDPDFNPSLLAQREGAGTNSGDTQTANTGSQDTQATQGTQGTQTTQGTQGTQGNQGTQGTQTADASNAQNAHAASPEVESKDGTKTAGVSGGTQSLPDPNAATASSGPPVVDSNAKASPDTKVVGNVPLTDPVAGTQSSSGATTAESTMPSPDVIAFDAPEVPQPRQMATQESSVPELDSVAKAAKASDSDPDDIALADPALKSDATEIPSLVERTIPDAVSEQGALALADPDLKAKFEETASIVDGKGGRNPKAPRLIIALEDPEMGPDQMPEAIAEVRAPQAKADGIALVDANISLEEDAPVIASLDRREEADGLSSIALGDPDAKGGEVASMGEDRALPPGTDEGIALVDPDSKDGERPAIVNGQLAYDPATGKFALADPDVFDPGKPDTGFDVLMPGGADVIALADPDMKGVETPDLIERNPLTAGDGEAIALADPDSREGEVPALVDSAAIAAAEQEKLSLADPEAKSGEVPTLVDAAAIQAIEQDRLALADPDAKAGELAELINGHKGKAETALGEVSLAVPAEKTAKAVETQGTTTTQGSTSSSGTGQSGTTGDATVATLVPTGDRPPDAETGGATIDSSALSGSGIAIVETLQKEKYYIRLGAYRSMDALVAASKGLRGYSLQVQVVVRKGVTYYLLYIGPVARDESGVILLNVRTIGFGDAYVLTGG
jgi:hypothetical protein